MKKSFFILLIAMIALIGCSSGGNSGGGSNPIGGTGGNTDPVASAGSNQNVTTGYLVLLDGSGSTDADGDPLTYTWTFTAVPGASSITDVDLSDTTAVDPEFTPDVDGDYELSLIVNDGTADSLPDTVTITASIITTSVLDDFNRADEGPPPSASWLAATGFDGFEVLGNEAKPTGATNINFWNTSFAADQEVYFTITAKPTVNNASSLGAYLRFDDTNANGYQITIVPQSDVDTIRIWRVDSGVNTKLGSDILQEFEVGDRILANVIGSDITVYIDDGMGDGFVPLGNRTDGTYTAGGRIGIYGVTTSGALDDFGGGTMVP